MATLNAAVEIREERPSDLREHIGVPSVYESSSVLDGQESAKSFELCERQLIQPYRKDYDAAEDKMDWPLRFDMTKWALFAAFHDGERVGAAVVAFRHTWCRNARRAPGPVDPLGYPRCSQGPSTRCGFCFDEVESWALERRCSELKVETQGTNVPACRLYERHGCNLAQVNYRAYPRFPDEVQLI